MRSVQQVRFNSLFLFYSTWELRSCEQFCTNTVHDIRTHISCKHMRSSDYHNRQIKFVAKKSNFSDRVPLPVRRTDSVSLTTDFWDSSSSPKGRFPREGSKTKMSREVTYLPRSPSPCVFSAFTKCWQERIMQMSVLIHMKFLPILRSSWDIHMFRVMSYSLSIQIWWYFQFIPSNVEKHAEKFVIFVWKFHEDIRSEHSDPLTHPLDVLLQFWTVLAFCSGLLSYETLKGIE